MGSELDQVHWHTGLTWQINQVHANKLIVHDPLGQSMEIEVEFGEFQWSPSGRYVLAEILPEGGRVGWRCILDTRLSRQVEVPNSYNNSKAKTNAIWLSDGSLLAVHSAIDEDGLSIQRWRILDTHEGLLLPDKARLVNSEELPGTSEKIAEYNIDWLAQTGENLVKLLISMPDDQTAAALFMLDWQEGHLEKLIDIPPNAEIVMWSPDGGVLILGPGKKAFFAPATCEGLFEMTSVLGGQAYAHTWLPPMLRLPSEE